MQPSSSRENWENSLEILWNDGERLVCRKPSHTGDGQQDSVIAVLPAAERPGPDSIARLNFEYSLREDLDEAWALRPTELTQVGGRVVLLLSDPGGNPLSTVLGEPVEVGRYLRLAVALSTALSRLHDRGLIHKDIKPSNIFVDQLANRVWLTGFGIASRVPRERLSPAPPEVVVGTFAYMAPEQTGRMNKTIDLRSDLYSLGVTLYQVLAGALPFSASEPIEWMHCHIAQQPIDLAERVQGVPLQLCAIVMKLLAKAAEDRYQSAASLTVDLQRCLAEWESSKAVPFFALGTHDASGQLRFRESLYGREAEIDRLLTALRSVVKSGSSEFVLVSGYSGIGKSSIVNELHRELMPSRGLFTAGKFDQYKRGIPYATLAQAFQSLVRQLLCKSDADLVYWRNALVEALAGHGQLMVNLVPELALIIGEQLPVPDLSGPEAQTRFLLAFRQFLRVFARKEHPLVLFLDDLQWLDAATLDLFAHLVTERDVPYLLLIGAYRDNEVGSSHPLARRLQTIRAAGRPVQQIALGGIQLEDVTRMIADALGAPRQEVGALATSVFAKTGGNPFFTIQFTATLVDQGLLGYEPSSSTWLWDIDRVNTQGISDNVVDLMVERLSRLPASSLQALKHLACLGNSVEISQFVTIAGASEQDTQKLLSAPLRSGLLLQVDSSYAFAHDRVHEAAYAMLSSAERSRRHREAGSRLLEVLDSAQVETQLFEIANQFNRVHLDDQDPSTTETAATLNLRAGRKAKSSAAYAAACDYLARGRSQIGETGWNSHYELSFALALEHAECEFLRGNLEETNGIVSTILSYTPNNVDAAAVYRLKVELHVVKSENDEAVQTALSALRLFGIDFSSHPDLAEVQEEFEKVWDNLGGRPIESFADLPKMTNPETLSAMRILAEIYAPAYFTDFNLMSLVICRMVNLSLLHGAADASNQGLALFGSYLMGPAFGRYDEGIRIGTLACELSSNRNVSVDMARVRCMMGLTSSWSEPLTTSIDWLRAAYRTGVEAGDLYFACYSSSLAATELLLRGHDLQDDAKECETYLNFARGVGFRDGIDLIITTERTIAALRGMTRSLSDFGDADFSETAFEVALTNERMNVVVFWYWTRKLMLHVLSGRYEDALSASEKVQPGRWAKIVQIQHLDYHYYSALALAALTERAPVNEGRALRERLASHDLQIKTWARETGSPTFSDKSALISAEIARIERRELDAERLYEESIRLAHQNGFLQNEALANELASRFYANRGFDKIARTYMRDARYCYLRWGADAKVRQLDELYPYAWEPPPLTSSMSTAVSMERLDLATVVKILQALSGEIVFDRLIDTLMRTAVEHAGAGRAVLVLTRDNKQQIEAEASLGATGVEVRLGTELSTETRLPSSIVHLVERTREHVIIDDALADPAFADDPYVQERSSRSVLCLPLISRTNLCGLLYLENNLAPRAFTPARLAVLKILASQAAISLENTRLYSDLEEREAKIRRLVDSDVIGIIIWDLDGRLIDCNDAFLRMVQYERADVNVGLRWFDLTPPDWQAIHAEQELEELLTTGAMQAREKEFFRKDGSRVPVLIGAAAFEGQPNQGVAYILDLTERKRAEAKILESESRYREVQANLAHANRVATTGQLSVSIAHEVNQPLTAMVTNTQAAIRWLDTDPPNMEEVRDALASVVRNGKRASDVIGRIRALVSKSSPRNDRFDLNEAFREVIELTRNEAGKHRITVRAQFAKELPPINGDRVQLQQVVLNMIINGIEAISTIDEGPREIRISTENGDAGRVLVKVQDSGPGFASDDLERAFDAFYTTKPSGMGVGLSICRSIVEAHGGKIWATPNKPRGTTLQFRLATSDAPLRGSR